MARITRDDTDRFFDYDINIPARTIYMGSTSISDDGNESGVDAIMAERAIKSLNLLDASEGNITIIMNNPGGDWDHGMAIYDAIKACKNSVTIKVFGMAMSMGSIILQAADERILAPNARFMMHYGYAGGFTESSNHLRWAQEEVKIRVKMEEIYMEKILAKNPTFKLKQLQKMLNPDTILSPEETVALGLADKIL